MSLEKPSIVRLFDDLAEKIHRQYETIGLDFAVSDQFLGVQACLYGQENSVLCWFQSRDIKTWEFKSQIFALSINRFQRNAWRWLFCCRSQHSLVQSSQLWDQRKFSWEFSDRRRRTLRLWGEFSFLELHIKCHHPKWLNWKTPNVQGLLGCIFSLHFCFLFASSFSPSHTFCWGNFYLFFNGSLSTMWWITPSLSLRNYENLVNMLLDCVEQRNLWVPLFGAWKCFFGVDKRWLHGSISRRIVTMVVDLFALEAWSVSIRHHHILELSFFLN